MLIDRFLPQFDFNEVHAVTIRAAPAPIDAAVDRLDLSESRLVRLLFALRGMPADALTMSGLERLGFRCLAHLPGEERVLGLIGRFWNIRGGLQCFAPEEFLGFNEPGFAKAAWNFQITRVCESIARLETETRVQCTDVVSRKQFARYWRVIRPFSGWIRKAALAQVKATAEMQSAYARS